MIGWLMRLLLWRFARRSGPIGLLTFLGGPFPRLVLLFTAWRYLTGRRSASPRSRWPAR